MKGIKFLKLIVISLLWLFIFFNNLGAYEKNPAEISNQIDLWYGEFQDLYRQAQYTNAENKLNKIIKTLDSDPYLESWRRAYQKQPTKETIYAIFKVLEGQLQREQEVAFKGVEQHRQTEEIKQREQKGWEKIALAQKYKEEQLRTKEEELARRRQELKLRKEELEQKRQEQLKARQEEHLWQREKKLERIALAKKEQQFKPRQEEQLAKQREERIKQFAELKAQQEQELKAKQEELARKEEEGLKARQERLKQIEELKAKREEERQARQAEFTRQKKEERLIQLAQLKTQKEEEYIYRNRQFAQEKQLKEQTRKAKEEELAKQKEERLKQQQELKAQREQELKARQEELARQKEERLRQKAELKAQREQELKARQEELAKQKEERLKQQQELKAQREEELKAKQEALAKQKEERLRQQAELKAKKEEELRVRQDQLAKEKEERIRQVAELKARQEQERKAREEELARQREEKQKQLAEEKAKREQERKAKEEELAQQRLKQQAELEAKKQEELKAKEEELAREREKLERKVNAMKRATAQEKAMTEAMLKKHRRDQAKLKKIEELWIRARRLYEQGMYAQAIKDFQKIIELEGNPRIKYTPFAKEYIEKAKNNLIQKNKVTLYKGIEQIEKEMVNEVLKRQVPPYIEPPKRIEQKEPTFLIEPPVLRKKLKATKITMDFDKVGLKSVISFLSQESGINFVASQKVLELALVVSARFKETSLDEAIKYITKNLGLVYRIDKEIVWVAHPEEIANEPMETRVYYLNRGGGLFTEFSPMSAGTTETSLGGSSAQISKVYTIEDTLKEVIPWPSDSKLSYDKRINALLVRNTPQNLQTLEDMLYSLDIEPLQVLIEARFLEVDITDTKELGLDWNLTGGDYALKQREGVYKKGIGSGSGVDFTAFTRAAEGLNLTYKGMLTNSQFQAVLHALEETKKIKTLSSPRITTLNNQLATMKVVDEWIYPTRYEYEIVQYDLNGDGDYNDAGETTFKNVPKDFLRRDVGILLKVIPAVGADKKTISLSLIPEVSEGTADGFSYTGDVTLPKFTSRNLSTTVIVNSGETVVLGGMIKESRTKTVTKVPVLGNIPLLGAFFKKNTDSIERKNLLIFVTAKVLSASGEEVIVAQK